jgi:hypothetical protein
MSITINILPNIAILSVKTAINGWDQPNSKIPVTVKKTCDNISN